MDIKFNCNNYFMMMPVRGVETAGHACGAVQHTISYVSGATPFLMGSPASYVTCEGSDYACMGWFSILSTSSILSPSSILSHT